MEDELRRDEDEEQRPETRPAEIAKPPPPVAPAETEQLAEVKRVGKLEVVQITDLNIDAAYQRDLNQALVQKIASKYNPAVAGSISVSRRANGTLWVMDGAHRVAGAYRAGETEMLAQVLEGLTPEEEAEFRLQGNVKRADKPAERFKAQLAAGWAESRAIDEIVRNFGTKINLSSPDAYHGINAISALESIYRRNKGIMLTRVLEYIQDAFGQIGGPTAVVAMLQGVAWLIEKHENEMDRGRMIEKMNVAGPKIIERMSRSIGMSNGGALWMNYYRAMIDLYNERLPEKSKLQWKTTGSGAIKNMRGSNWSG